MPNQIPVNPTLPKNFDDTPNERRSKSQLDQWWDHPYCLTQPDGKYLVRCLNGGAWDRSTVFGLADSYEEACQLAEQRQAEWVARRGEAMLSMDNGSFAAMIQPQRPDQEYQIFPAASKDVAIELISKLNARNAPGVESL